MKPNVKITADFNEEITHLSPSITHITFGDKFNQPVDDVLPCSLTHLDFGQRFNCTIKSLPPTITSLTFGFGFNKMANFPPALKVLKLGYTYSSPIGKLPDSIHTLEVNVTETIDYLPPSLTFLDNRSAENKITCPLPSSITHLCISDINPTELANLPSLSYLETHGDNFTPGYDNLPKTLTQLGIFGYWNGTLDSLPPALTHLNIQSLTFKTPLEKLPNTVTHLTLGDLIQPLRNLPLGITHLSFGRFFNSIVDELPPSITHIVFGEYFDKPIDNLPQSLTHLVFGSKFNQLVDRLPPNITHITFGFKFNQPIARLPSHLTHLVFGYSFNHPTVNLPSSIKHLTLGHSFRQPIHHLPYSITHLTISIICSGFFKTINQILNFASHFEEVNLVIAYDITGFYFILFIIFLSRANFC